MSNCNFAPILANNALVKQVFLHCQIHMVVIYEFAAINKN